MSKFGFVRPTTGPDLFFPAADITALTQILADVTALASPSGAA